ncbi:MAG: GTPase ObgE [Candidatus Zambryskibacteria bacterium CG_4_9_14_3_um_filter_42_15]|uniref:GTPase Obg n=1 Tax=Candidatus Zambryskibacteria bacterium CG_4_9_14_3_um_filter_42_15 TaxID=1975112 RepID=A0A2M7WT64_9BACT|nr:MAG: GTPase ObgE [Candidatus Zambryskibacteria bacterium CG_4_9_14_3_um_filter_42_15]
MFIDEINLLLRAGRGGDGVVRWRHEKGKDHAGPAGGNGGKGGDIYALAVRDIGILSAYRNVKEFEAGNGEEGGKNVKQGGTGKDIEIKFPVGSRLTNLSTGYSVELLKDGDKVLLLHGGRGGLGNDHFKGSTNIRPKESTSGELGEEANFHIELLLVVDVGIIGLPNVGKSSLLNALTHAHSKIGDFPFTTLEPALGSFYGLILADIPGLIEGAAEGRGLGHKFLRHIERTKALVHCISAEVEDPLEAYRVVRNELELYNKEMMGKSEIVVLTKVDTISDEDRDKKLKLLKSINENVFPISILDDNLVKEFGNFLTKTFK